MTYERYSRGLGTRALSKAVGRQNFEDRAREGEEVSGTDRGGWGVVWGGAEKAGQHLRAGGAEAGNCYFLVEGGAGGKGDQGRVEGGSRGLG